MNQTQPNHILVKGHAVEEGVNQKSVYSCL